LETEVLSNISQNPAILGQHKLAINFTAYHRRWSCVCSLHEDNWGSRSIAPLTPDLSTRCMYMVGFTPWPATLPPEKQFLKPSK